MRQDTHHDVEVDHPTCGKHAGSEVAPAAMRSVELPRPECPAVLRGPRHRPPHRPRRAARPLAAARPASASAASAVPPTIGPAASVSGAARLRVCAPVPSLGGPTDGDHALRGATAVDRRPSRSGAGLRLVGDPQAALARPSAYRWRRAAAGLAVALAAAAMVLGLGRLADGVAHLRAPAPPAGAVAVVAVPDTAASSVTVTVRASGTVWDVVDAIAPGVSGARRAALVDQVVADNALPSLRVSPGQTLRVPLI